MTMANLLSDLDVTLIIKAPNQKIADQTVKCEMEWTVKRLKQHLSEVYPNKPNENQQRIIYSGRLLNDNLTLKEILKRDNETHTVHLVCPPEKSSSPNSSISTGQESVPSPTPLREETVNSANHVSSRLNLSSISEEEMRQLYQEYYGYAYQWYHQQMLRNYMGGSFPAVSSSPTSLAAASASPSAAGAARPEAGRPGREEPAEAEARGAAPAAAPPAAMAAGPGGFGGEFDEENFERDWLDWFYYALRVAILIGLLNYYSSLSKILTAVGVSCIFGLYRFVFQRRNRQTPEPQRRALAEPVENPENAPAPAQAPPQAPAPAPAAEEPRVPEAAAPRAPEATGQGEDRSEANGSESVSSTTVGGTVGAEEAQPEQLSMVRKLWNSFYLCTQFFVTLFTSLVPERIPPLDLN